VSCPCALWLHRLSHFTPKQVIQPFVPPRCALINKASMRFILGVGGDIHVSPTPRTATTHLTSRVFRLFMRPIHFTKMGCVEAGGPGLCPRLRQMWEAITGKFFRSFQSVTTAISGITCACLDSPRDRSGTKQ
jgi:hypothetical protein